MRDRLRRHAAVRRRPRPRGPAGLARVDATAPGRRHHLRRIMQFPPLPDMPEFLRGRASSSSTARCSATRPRAAELLAPLRALEPGDGHVRRRSRRSGSRTSTWIPRSPIPAIGDRADARRADRRGDRRDRRRRRAGLRLAAADGRAPPPRRRARPRRGAGALSRFDGEYLYFAARHPDGPRVVAALEAHFASSRAALAPHRQGRRTSTSPSGPPTRPRSTARSATRACAGSRPRSIRSRSSAPTTRSRPRDDSRRAPPARMRAGTAAERLRRRRRVLALRREGRRGSAPSEPRPVSERTSSSS